MSQNSTSPMRIPTPVGGIPLSADAAPSIVFAVLYGLLFPFIISRLFVPGRRSFLLTNCTMCTVERVVVFSMRASQALDPGRRPSVGLLKYLQLSYAQGFVQLAQDAVPLLRCLIINASGGPDRLEPLKNNDEEASSEPKVVQEDLPRVRFWMRRSTEVFNWTWMASTISGLVGFLKYGSALHDQKVADRLFNLRYVSSAAAFALMLIVMIWTYCAMVRMKHIDKSACRRILLLLGLLIPVMIYRFIVMRDTIPELLYTGPGSQQSTAARACFYVFHVLPEWLGSALLIVPNTRWKFQTGAWGDWRSYDGQKGCAEARKDAIEKDKKKRELEAATAATSPK